MRNATKVLALAAALTLAAAAIASAATPTPAPKPKPATPTTTAKPATTAPAPKPAPAPAGITPYEPQKWVVSASLGFGDAGYYGTGASPMIGVSAEYGFNDKISIGGSVGHSSSTYDYGSYLGTNYKWTYSYNIIAARGSYHFGDQLKVENLDAYAGVALGYNMVSVKSPENSFGINYSTGASAMRAGVYGGGRYWFSPKFAGFGELGFGLGNVVLGLSTRF